MKRLRHAMFISAAVATLGMGAAGTAQADAFASSILDISNFRLLHTGGSGFTASDFTVLTGTNDAHATASKDSVFSNGALSIPLSGGNPNVAQQCVGGCPIGSDVYTPLTSPPPVPGNFGYADQNLAGSAITAGGAHAQTRADASLGSVNGVTSGNSDVGTSTTFRLSAAGADTMRVAFDATPYTQAFVNGSVPAFSNARLSWSISIVDLTTGTSVLSYSPNQLNSDSNLSRSNLSPGLSTYNPGMISLFANSDVALNSTDLYQITIQHNTLGNVLAVPEPSNVAMLGLGLLGLLMVSRRKNRK